MGLGKLNPGCSCCGGDCDDRVIEKVIVKLDYVTQNNPLYVNSVISTQTYEVPIGKSWKELSYAYAFVIGSKGMNNSKTGIKFYERRLKFTFTGTPWTVVAEPTGSDFYASIAYSTVQNPGTPSSVQTLTWADRRFFQSRFFYRLVNPATGEEEIWPRYYSLGDTATQTYAQGSYTIQVEDVLLSDTGGNLGGSFFKIRPFPDTNPSLVEEATFLHRNLIIAIMASSSTGTNGAIWFRADLGFEQDWVNPPQSTPRYASNSNMLMTLNTRFSSFQSLNNQLTPADFTIGFSPFGEFICHGICVNKTGYSNTNRVHNTWGLNEFGVINALGATPVWREYANNSFPYPWGNDASASPSPWNNLAIQLPFPIVSVAIVYADESKKTECSKLLIRVPDDPTFNPRKNVESDDPVQVSKMNCGFRGLAFEFDKDKSTTDDDLLVTQENLTGPLELGTVNNGCVDAKTQVFWRYGSLEVDSQRTAFSINVAESTDPPVITTLISPLIPSTAISGEIVAVYRSEDATFSIINDPYGLFAISSDGVITFTGTATDADALLDTGCTITIRATRSTYQTDLDVVFVLEDTQIIDTNPTANQVNENFTGGNAVGFTGSVPGKTINQWAVPTNPLGFSITTGGILNRSSSNDAEQAEFGRIVIRARDTDGNFYFRSLVVRILDVADRFESLGATEWGTSVANVVPGTIVGHMRPFNLDVSNKVQSFILTANPGNAFSVNLIGDVRLDTALPNGTYSITGRCTFTDGTILNRSISVIIANSPATVITDIDTNADDVPHAHTGEVPIQTSAFNASFPNRLYSYSLFDNSFNEFAIDSNSGRVSANVPLLHREGPIRTIVVRSSSTDIHCRTVLERRGRKFSNTVKNGLISTVFLNNVSPPTIGGPYSTTWYAELLFFEPTLQVEVRRKDGVLQCNLTLNGSAGWQVRSSPSTIYQNLATINFTASTGWTGLENLYNSFSITNTANPQLPTAISLVGTNSYQVSSSQPFGPITFKLTK